MYASTCLQKRKAQAEALAAAQFHAQPCLSTIVPPFEAKPAKKALTEVYSNCT